MLTIGVDTHKRLHVAVALDSAGRVLATWQGANTTEGWRHLQHWAAALGSERVWGIEGSGQYGRGLAQALIATGEPVYEVNPRWTAAARQRARQSGKSDRRDATAIAQLVRQEECALPRVQATDATSVLALLTSERNDALAAATRLRNQLHQIVLQLDPDYQTTFPDLTDPDVVAALATYTAAPEAAALTQAQAAAVRRLAARLALLQTQVQELATEIAAQARHHCAPLMTLVGVGALTAGMLAGYLGPGDRFVSDARLAAYAGVAPLETGSAGQVRHRLNRSGQRQLNALIHRIALTQARCSAEARTYLARRQQDGKTWREALRALKRYIVRAIWRQWRACLAAVVTAPSAPLLT